MIYSLKNYQREAVDSLKELINSKLSNAFRGDTKTRNSIVFKAPTGSGKTFIASSLFEELIDENKDYNFCIIWCCPGKGELHKQSYENVKTYVAGNPVCSLLEEDFFGSRKFIKKHEVVFINWEKLVDKDKETGEWINNLMKDQEGMSFIDVLEKTRNNGTKLILVIDESHIGANASTRIQELKNSIIIPDVVLEMSATPFGEVDYTVDAQDVIDEGMIKNDIIVNEGINKMDESLIEKDSEQIILEKGYAKREELVEEFKRAGANVNPLVLIQIPNVDAGEAKKLVIKDFLKDRGITEDNGKLKLWCDNKANFDKKAIKNNLDITEYLIFKTAVATGWDCPRAHILIKFREGNSETFEIQTIGRILRTPEAKSYDNEILDNAYVYTNSVRFETKQDTYNPNKIKTIFSYFREGYNKKKVYDETELTSFYRSRQGDYNSAGSDFNKFYQEEFMKYFELTENDKYIYLTDNIAKKLVDKGLKLSVRGNDSIVEETTIGSRYIDTAQLFMSNEAKTKMADNDIKDRYYSLIRSNLNGLAYVRSKSPINSAIIDAFSVFYDVFPRNEKTKAIQKLVVDNSGIFTTILDHATNEYRNYLISKSGKTGEHYKFEWLDKRDYTSDYHEKIISTKSLYEPLYVLRRADGSLNKLEKDFLSYLDSKSCVRWYFENGPEYKRTNFGISYNNGMNTFQPDFIVKFNNGDVGIFDTKPIGDRIEDTKKKEEALYAYINKENRNRTKNKLIGGIVVRPSNSKHFYYYFDEEYHDLNENHSGWNTFDDLIEKIENDIHNKEYLKEHTKQ